MSNLKKISVCEISLSPNADRKKFEEFMKTEVFPTIRVGQSTRGGMVTAQYLVKATFPEPEHNYLWIVEWDEEGGSPFGSAGAPEVPVNQLESLGASTSQKVFEVVAEDSQSQ